MNGRFLSSVNRASPVDIRLLAYGSVIGALYGLSKLGDSSDEATAQGIAMSIVVTLAIWMGLKACRIVLLLAEKRLDSMTVRLTALKSRLGRNDGNALEGRSIRPVSSAWLTLLSVCIGTTPVGMVAFTGGGIMAIIDLRVDVYTLAQYVSVLIFGASCSLLCIGVQWSYIWKTARKISRLEQSLDPANSLDGFASNTQTLGREFSKMDTLVYKITGQRLAAP